jgi:hypothetical protein
MRPSEWKVYVMPCHDRTQLKQIATEDMPVISGALRAAQKALGDASQGHPFAERVPDGRGEMYEETRKAWMAAHAGLHQLLGQAAQRVDQSAQRLLHIRANYAVTEEQNEQLMNDLLKDLDNLGGR